MALLYGLGLISIYFIGEAACRDFFWACSPLPLQQKLATLAVQMPVAKEPPLRTLTMAKK